MTWKASINVPAVGEEFVVTVDVSEDGYVMDGKSVMDDNKSYFLLFYKKDPSGKKTIDEWKLGCFAHGEGPKHFIHVIAVADKEIKAHDRKEVMNGHA
ncbi:MAG: hypothetical protein IPF95_11700 [Flavobacteriales bacterium]|nr:hypothetical protein [Flavobacteriales bacterium]